MKTRQIFTRTEALRRAFLFVARNVTLPDQVRMRAQHRLAQLPKRSTPNIIKNTCIKTGKQRGARPSPSARPFAGPSLGAWPCGSVAAWHLAQL